MPVLTCPNPACGRASRLPDEAVGRKVTCPACRRPFLAHPSTADADTATGAKSSVTLGPVGRFVIRSKVGEGAFGAVYRAYDPQLDREVALKVPHAAVLDSPKRVERFLREAKAAANLRHPHIVPVFDAGSDGGRHYIASAFIAGQKLADAIEASDGGLDVDRAARLVRELAEALAYAHEQGIVHRDVKPDNVMLDAQDRVHLMDFGLAVKQDAESRLTSDGAVMGTPAYMAPEQAKGDTAAVGPAADQYACGVVLYELLTGQTPFAGPVPVLIHHQIHTDPEPPSTFRAKLPKDLETVCLKAMAKRPEDRYPDCQTLADDLRRWQEGEPITARPAGGVEKAVRWVRKYPAAAGLVMASGLAVVLLGVAVGFAVLGLQAESARHKAEEAEGKAVNSRDAAERAKTDAEQARDEAKQAKGEADTARMTAEEEKQKADKARDKALTEQREAERQRKIAEQEKQRADAARVEAEKAQAAEKQANETLKEEKKKLEVVKYGRTIQVAYQEWRDHNPAAVRVLLDSTNEEHRGWEWDHLNRLHDSTLATLAHPGKVVSVAVSPDGKVLTGTADGVANVWDAKTGNLNHTFPKFPGSVRVAVSPDGKRVVTGDGKGDVRVWDSAWKEVNSLKGHTQNVTAVAFSPDGSRLVTGSLDRTARVWDVGTGTAVKLPHPDDVWAVAFSPNTDRVATVCGDLIVRVWDLADVKNPQKLKHPKGVKAVAFNRDGSRIATAGEDRTVRVWDAATGGQLLTLPACPAAVLAVAFNPDGTRIASAGEDRVIRLWDSTSGSEVLTLSGHLGPVNAVAFTPAGDRLISGSDDQTAKVWDAVTGVECLPLVGHADAVNAVTFSPKGFQVVTAGEDNSVRVWDPATGRELFKLSGHTKPVYSAAYAAASGRLVTAGQDETARVWEVNNGTSITRDHHEWVRASAISPDGKRAVTAANSVVNVWEVDTKATLFSLAGHTGGVTAVAFSKRGDKIVTAGEDKIARVWGAQSEGKGVELAGKDGHTKRLLAAAFDPAGARVVTGSEDKTAKVWDATSGKVQLTLSGHTDAVSAAAFHPTEKRIVTASHDGTVKVWHAETGAELLTLKGFPKEVKAVAWDADGWRLAVGGGSGTARIYDRRPFRDTRPAK